MSERPLFLAGIDRSGIGLLGELLESHPDLAVTRRLNFWDFYVDRFGDLGEPARLEACLGAMMSYTRIRRLEPDPDRLRAEFRAGEATYVRLFQLLQEQNAARLGKSRWADKSLMAEGHADAILSAFPDAVMIHILRDPRDRYASRATHRSAGRGGIGSGTAAWLWSARLARANARNHPGRYLVVRYEDLVARPEPVMRSVCDFAHLPFDPSVLSPVSAPGRRLHSRSVGRYRGDLTPGEIWFSQLAAGRMMRAWAYDIATLEWGKAEKMRYLATRMPRELAGLVLWAPARWVSAAKGRRPSGRRTVPGDRLNRDGDASRPA
ncbi:MAG: sulfotransferase family protein [Actinomycetota bacterium]